MKKRIGLIFIIIGILHSLFGLFKYSDSFSKMLSHGFVNSAVTIENGRAFWFTFAGILFIALGYLTNYLEKHELNVPRPLGWMLFASSVIGVIFLPVSGFWVILLPAILIISNKSRKGYLLKSLSK